MREANAIASSCRNALARGGGYNDHVRRLVSLFLFLCFSFGLISPLLALDGVSDVNLPACCRRNGEHKCMRQMHEAPSGTSVTTVQPKCPNCPGGPSVMRHDQVSLHAAALIFAEIASHPAFRPQTLAWARVAMAGARHKRGPPVSPFQQA